MKKLPLTVAGSGFAFDAETKVDCGKVTLTCAVGFEFSTLNLDLYLSNNLKHNTIAYDDCISHIFYM